MSEKKKRFLITCTELMMLQFLVPHVNHILECGNEVDIACSEVGGRFNQLSDKFIKKINMYKINATRSPWTLKNFDGYRQLKKIIDNGNYDIIWTNEPVMGVITRLAALKARKRKHTKVLYMAHGFHFYDGGPLLNWIIYYPIEKFMSRYTDVLVTMNKEDYARAQNKMHAKRTEYVSGVGIDIAKIKSIKIDRDKKRVELGIPKDSIMLLSVGELSKRKNHEIVIRALAQIKDENIIYAICGKGALEAYLKKLANDLGLSNRVFLLGFRTDVIEICKAADIFAFPSLQEGLPVALMEAMACGLPVTCSKIRGNIDLVQDNINGIMFAPHRVDEAKKSILKILNTPEYRLFVGNEPQTIERYSLDSCISITTRIYRSI